MKLYRKIFAVIFISAVIVFAIFNIKEKHNEIKISLMELEGPSDIHELRAYTLNVEEVLAKNLLFDNEWNEVYAKAYKKLGKNEENGFKYVRDKNGILYVGNFWNTPADDVPELIKRINVIRKKVEDEDTKVVVLLYPCKFNENWSDGYLGIPYSDYNHMIDDMTAYFRYYSINYVDYRQFFLENEWELQDIFYATDHHWKTPAAFAGYQELVKYLNEEFDADLDVSYTQKSRYNTVTYEDVFLGSQGKDAGIAYSGLDDFVLITPKFDTDYTYKYINHQNLSFENKGDIYDTLIDISIMENDNYYDKDLYRVYMGAIRLKETVINHNNEEGLNVLFLRDSFTTPLSVFFSSHCNEMELMWTNNSTSEEMEAKVEEKNYDYVFIGVSIDGFAEDGFEIYVDEVLTNE